MPTSDHELDQLRTELLRLTPAQQVAIEKLVGGATHASAADAAGVARETVTRWAGHHPAFKATMNLCRYTIVAEQIDATRRIRGKALARIEDALDGGELDPLAVLRALGASTPSVGFTVPEEILDAEQNKLRLALPPMPMPQDEEGMLERLLNPVTDAERAETLTITRLAAASGVLPGQSEASSMQ